MTSAVIVVPNQGRFYLHAPWLGESSRSWIKEACGSGTRPEWVRGKPVTMLPTDSHWEIARSHLNRVIEGALKRYETVIVYRMVASQVRCDLRCVEARGHDCVCSCGGRNHRGTTEGFTLVSDTTLAGTGSSRWTRMEYARQAHPAWTRLLAMAV